MSRLQVARTLTDLHCILMRRRSLLSCPLARFLAGLLVLCVAVPIAGCDAEEAARPVEVVLYTSVDEPVARAVIERFQHETGYRVRLVTDTEATRIHWA